MNVAIVGRSQINGILVKKLAEEGFIPFIFENIDEITGFSGEKLDFIVRTPKMNLNAGYVIITDKLLNDNSLSNPDKITGSDKPVVFILDHPDESPAYFTVEALKNAINLVRRKKRVFYLSRFMRTAGNQVESLYKEARNSGVSFIKYRKLAVEFDKASGIYLIEAFDEYDSIRIETPSVITVERASSGSSTDRIAKLFRLKRNENGSVNEDRSFLFPSLTGRDGVYFMDSASYTDGEDISERVRFTITEMKNEISGIFKNTSACAKVLDMPISFLEGAGIINDRHPGIDAARCAFCYTCFRACPHSAMAPDYENSVMRNLNNGCQSCGICISVCPADAIRMVCKGEVEEKQGFAAVEKTPVGRRKLLKIFCCENSGFIAFKKIMEESDGLPENIDVMPVSCGGEISVETILSELAKYEKVLVVTCVDEACRHFEGNKRAERFVCKAREMLKASGMDEGRIECLKISHAMPDLLYDQIKEMI